MTTTERVFIITGGGTGTGAATAFLVRASGYQVVVSGRRPEPLRRLAEETRAHAHPTDAGDPDAFKVSWSPPWPHTAGWTGW